MGPHQETVQTRQNIINIPVFQSGTCLQLAPSRMSNVIQYRFNTSENGQANIVTGSDGDTLRNGNKATTFPIIDYRAPSVREYQTPFSIIEYPTDALKGVVSLTDKLFDISISCLLPKWVVSGVSASVRMD